VRVEAALFGYVALMQRIAIGLGTMLLGMGLGRAGIATGVRPGPAALATLKITLALAPLGLFALAAVLMVLNPLKRGAHDALLRDFEA
jgi:GPH family glycoside/pentoside/hexuronide:cation symporter